MKKTIGGNRLGSGNKMTVDLRTYERSTHDLSYLWRSTMAAGTLVPFLSELGLPGDTFDINLEAEINTHPTIGPLFGSFKVQLDIFQCPIRLYQAALNNNKLGVGMNMATIKLPQLQLRARPIDYTKNLDNQQINPSALLSYLNIRGVGDPAAGSPTRDFNALPMLSYWDIYKNYYANRSEGVGAYINNPITLANNITGIQIYEGNTFIKNLTTGTAAAHVITGQTKLVVNKTNQDDTIGILLNMTGATSNSIYYEPHPNWGVFMVKSESGNSDTYTIPNTNNPNQAGLSYIGKTLNTYTLQQPPSEVVMASEPTVQLFPLEAIDEIREEILQAPLTSAYTLSSASQDPYGPSIDAVNNVVIDAAIGTVLTPIMCSQQGLAIKTYQSDLFNNWMETEWIDGTNGISEVTSVDTTGGSFSIDTLNLSKKVYDMLNRIAISGGSYDDWIDAVYTHNRYNICTTPMYQGGLIKELIFQEVVSNSQATGADGEQPLGTLAGKGRLSGKHKGGQVTIKVDEPSYIIGIISLTPRVDYSQGNKWDIHLKTMDDFHKPALDEIGFQDLITEQMAWWDTKFNGVDAWVQNSAGKQPAWLNYMTNVNQVRGNFAIEDNEMFMTLNRRYEAARTTARIADLTTYIDPVKFNQIFAQTSRDAQNFWTQIAVNITARRKMSSKVMPNL